MRIVTADKSSILTVKVSSTNEDYSHIACVCRACLESKHLLQSSGEQKGETNKSEIRASDQKPLVWSYINLARAKNLNITIGSNVHITPPWLVLFIHINVLQ